MNIRPARSDDIEPLHLLVESAYRGDSAKRGWTHEADLLDGQLQGCVQLSRVDGSVAYLGLLTVDPALQAGGLGRALLTHGETYAREQWQSQAMEMTVIRQRAELIAYYERRGYVRTGEYRPFPHGNPRFGLPKSDALEFAVLRKPI